MRGAHCMSHNSWYATRENEPSFAGDFLLRLVLSGISFSTEASSLSLSLSLGSQLDAAARCSLRSLITASFTMTKPRAKLIRSCVHVAGLFNRNLEQCHERVLRRTLKLRN